MTSEEIAAIDRECEEQHISQRVSKEQRDSQASVLQVEASVSRR